MPLKTLMLFAVFNILGGFVGNFLSGPFIFDDRTWFQSFICGLISAGVGAVLWLIIIGIVWMRK